MAALPATVEKAVVISLLLAVVYLSCVTLKHSHTKQSPSPIYGHVAVCADCMMHCYLLLLLILSNLTKQNPLPQTLHFPTGCSGTLSTRSISLPINLV